MGTQAHLPANSDHASQFSRDDMIEEYGGMVDAQIAKKSIMRQFIDMPLLTGTDTRTVRRMADTSLQVITDERAGTEMEADRVNFDRAQVTVDTVVMARAVRTLLNEVQTDFGARQRIAQDHGKTIAKFFDASLLNMGIKTALTTVTSGVADAAIKGNQGRDLGKAFRSGKTVNLGAPNAELDPDALYAGFEALVVELQENDVDTDEMALFLRPRQHAVLFNHDKLISRDFSRDNGDFAEGKIKTIMGVPLVSTNRLADASINASSELSDLSAPVGQYVLTAAQLTCQGLILHPDSLLAAEAIPLSSNIWFDDLRKAWYIDSWLSYGASSRRGDQTAALFTNAGPVRP